MYFPGINIVALSLAIVRSSGFLTIPTAQSRSSHNYKIVLYDERFRRSSPDNSRPLNLTPGAIEFYSGIGGNRVALEAVVEKRGAGSDSGGVAVVKSYEINAVANAVYEHNFPGARVTRLSIEHLSGEDVDGAADVWLLRIGKQMDIEDPRAFSLMHLLSLLEEIAIPPSHFFLENVRGFEGSRAHERLIEVLSGRGYHVEQYLLSPVQLGIPNTRLRYYCLATRRGNGMDGHVAAMEHSPPFQVLQNAVQSRGVSLRTLSEYLDLSLAQKDVIPLLLSPKAAGHANPSLRFDVVTLRSTETTTFTKGYGKHAGRAGPVILLSDDGTRRVSEDDLGRFPNGLNLGPAGRELRWFSDREMLRLHGFPEKFGFPPGVTLRQRFGLIGNSVNVDVVALLLRRLLFREEALKQEMVVEDGGINVAAAVLD